jgi:hypothetical protein
MWDLTCLSLTSTALLNVSVGLGIGGCFAVYLYGRRQNPLSSTFRKRMCFDIVQLGRKVCNEHSQQSQKWISNNKNNNTILNKQNNIHGTDNQVIHHSIASMFRPLEKRERTIANDLQYRSAIRPSDWKSDVQPLAKRVDVQKTSPMRPSDQRSDNQYGVKTRTTTISHEKQQTLVYHTSNPSPYTVVIRGPRGIGKTSLINNALYQQTIFFSKISSKEAFPTTVLHIDMNYNSNTAALLFYAASCAFAVDVGSIHMDAVCNGIGGDMYSYDRMTLFDLSSESSFSRLSNTFIRPEKPTRLTFHEKYNYGLVIRGLKQIVLALQQYNQKQQLAAAAATDSSSSSCTNNNASPIVIVWLSDTLAPNSMLLDKETNTSDRMLFSRTTRMKMINEMLDIAARSTNGQLCFIAEIDNV